MWALSRKKPYAADLPDMEFAFTRRISFGTAVTILLISVGFWFVLGLMIGPGVSTILVSAAIGLGLAISWRSRLNRRMVGWGLIIGLIAGLGILFLGNGDISWAIFNMVTLPPAFMGGALLIRRTGLAQSRILQGEYFPALKGFCWACLLAVPAALLNQLGSLHETDLWVTRWWQPFYAIVPGIAEETWARLFLTTLVYALLRPTTNHRPRRAMLVAILTGALLHGFSHTGIDPFGLVIGSLLYGIPAALLFIKYDFEHAVGYHFLIDFIRYIAAY